MAVKLGGVNTTLPLAYNTAEQALTVIMEEVVEERNKRRLMRALPRDHMADPVSSREQTGDAEVRVSGLAIPATFTPPASSDESGTSFNSLVILSSSNQPPTHQTAALMLVPTTTDVVPTPQQQRGRTPTGETRSTRSPVTC